MRENTLRNRSLRAFILASVLVSGLACTTGTATAAIDSSSQIIDRQDRTVEAIQSDTRIDFVPPLDGNPLTREWFHNGEASYRVSGPNAQDWSGHITIGYQVGYPATFSGRIKFQWYTPGLGLDLGGTEGGGLRLFDLIPRAGVELEVGFGPGIQTFECTGGDVSGVEGFIRMSGFHGTVTGVLGQTTIRPFVRVISANGDAVYTYGRLWTI
ncbi:MspA family porin [Nocardia sp. NBC_00565]|uniref:MspA family porin n=1 Tax=Nocardia sp. NBC_00565 TaxID=2975993 RepID=UPI002E81591F|nr:MspA family porin [Nocardia sp. NBC_00565]WUC05241.1 MspA family porin [Nocardia sp. NBC_00565]